MQTTKQKVCPMPHLAVKKPPARRLTVDRVVLHDVTMVTGWQAIYADDHGEHWCGPVHGLALATRHRYDARTHQRLPDVLGFHEDETREIVAVAYVASDGWNVVDDASNFCGLLAPRETLATFEAAGGCYHAVANVALPANSEGA